MKTVKFRIAAALAAWTGIAANAEEALTPAQEAVAKAGPKQLRLMTIHYNYVPEN